MVPPTGLTDTLAAFMLITSAYCVARLVAAKAWSRTLHRDTNIAHAADALAMAGMLVGAYRTIPDGAWEAVFAALTLWFAVRGARFVVSHGLRIADSDHVHHLSHYVSHLVMAGAMLYMFVEASPAGSHPSATSSMSAMGGAGAATSNLTALTLLFVVVLFGSAVWHADGLTRYTTVRRVLAGAPTASVGAFRGAPATPLERSDEVAPDDDAAADQSRSLAPRLEMACHIALCVTMGYMLVLLF